MVAAGVGAVATAASAPVWVTAGATVLVGGAIVWGVGKAYENTVPLRTRERIDEGIKDAARHGLRRLEERVYQLKSRRTHTFKVIQGVVV